MLPSTVALRSSAAAIRRPAAQFATQRASVGSIGLGVAGKRFNTNTTASGKPKLRFRFGLRDIPVETYPVVFVVAAACVGAGIALGRQIWSGDLRLKPSGPAKP
ncbi:hypothetical protein L202_00520 [Cryptococcus amylolentus CBS 6039]|uniref:Uncharacterized protein n=2 Tax=Cryptococcus amylolentus TaxID=104669 RepID=A0A1E3I7Z3_9TREE|nr:hypothetical protein L202_00520 [Cryptococcus amylolentus CBS 6039]ODN84608.1 hypothetical protein L202_00520 [Cryptococcus amylolentus CBS 6039]ODO11626.1 hypothetical protein I350_00410 [Cryptococcus amylolentus CBS 6273]